jgi:pimeloyl-ACP methyl ester carboxylesterase
MLHSARTSTRLKLAAALLITIEAGGLSAQETEHGPRTRDLSYTLARSGYFFVNGEYVDREAGQIMARQMYVSFKIPQRVTQAYPIVMIHGGAQTGTNFEGTPDGRHGWADYFASRGFEVYVVDQPGRGRSAYHEEVYGPATAIGTEFIEQRFTAPEDFNLWPQAKRHTRWPGTGHVGDPFFDQFYSSQVPFIADAALTQELNQEAGAALLDSIGPAVIVTHSQSGPFGWLIADARPELVKAIVAIEPGGPPFHDVAFLGPPDWFADGPLSRPWGVTTIPITYEPAVTDPAQLNFALEDEPESPDLVRCRLQTEPARQLPKLHGIPIVIIAGEASYHAAYDHCTARYLEQAGVDNDFVRLEEVGITGHGHMMMLEKNNLRIARFIKDWLGDNVGN